MLHLISMLVFLSSYSYAQTSETAVLSVEGVNSNLNQVLNPNPKCDDPNEPCVDLFRASCMNENGEMKSPVDIEGDAKAKVEASRELVAKALGESSFWDALRNHLGKNGIIIKSDLEKEKKEKFLKEGIGYDNATDFLENAVDCSKSALSEEEKNRLNQIAYQEWTFKYPYDSAKSDLEYSEQTLKRYEESAEAATGSMKETYRGLVEKQRLEVESKKKIVTEKKTVFDNWEKELRDLKQKEISSAEEQSQSHKAVLEKSIRRDPFSFYSSLISLCTTANEQLEKKLKEAREASAKDPNIVINDQLLKLDFSKECSKHKLAELRSKLISLERIPDPKAKETAASQHFSGLIEGVSHLKDFYINNYSISNTLSQSEQSPSNVQKREAESKRNKLKALCALADDGFKNDVKKQTEKFMVNVSSSQIAVEFILKDAYADEKKIHVEKLFQKAKAGVLDFVENEIAALPGVAGSPKLEKIKRETEALGYFWAAAPSADRFSTSSEFPLPVIDRTKFDRMDFSDTLGSFLDPSYTFLSELNASYHSRMIFGERATAEKVNLLPSLIGMSERDPYSVLMIMAHEIGHKIGHDVSAVNGHDLRSEYAPLVACLSDEKSIGMKAHQKDESLSDWISSKFMGKTIMSLPKEERKPAALRIAGFFCEVYRKDFYSSPPSLDGVHPEATLRVNGIFGANSDVRSALGCQEEGIPSRFQECTLRGKP